jgi:hypothetical protein
VRADPPISLTYLLQSHKVVGGLLVQLKLLIVATVCTQVAWRYWNDGYWQWNR